MSKQRTVIRLNDWIPLIWVILAFVALLRPGGGGVFMAIFYVLLGCFFLLRRIANLLQAMSESEVRSQNSLSASGGSLEGPQTAGGYI